MTGGSYFLTGLDYLDENGHNEFYIRERQSSGFFVLPSGSKAVCIIVRAASHIYVHYQTAEKRKLVKLLCLGEVAILVHSIAVDHGNL